jgi:hypothetical protein
MKNMTFANNFDCTGKKQQKKPKAREEKISGDDSVTEVGAECRKELGLDGDDDEEKRSGKSGRKTKKRKEEKRLEASSSEEEERRRGKKKQKKVKNFIFKRNYFEGKDCELK